MKDTFVPAQKAPCCCAIFFPLSTLMLRKMSARLTLSAIAERFASSMDRHADAFDHRSRPSWLRCHAINIFRYATIIFIIFTVSFSPRQPILADTGQ